jgi:FkbM family methyltransferase
MNIKKLLKCFVPYGFLVLTKRIKEAMPLNVNFGEIKNDFQDNCLCNIKIANLSEECNLMSVHREDYKYPIYLRNNTTDIPAYKEIIERHKYCVTTEYEPKYIIDAGANIGMAAIYFANKYKDARIIAIEPESANYELLKKNTENYANITVIKAALWKTTGEIFLFDTGLGNDGFMTGENSMDTKTPIKTIKQTIETTTIDEILDEFHINSIDILKIDIEGSEKEIFESCENWIHNTNSIIIELHERMKKGCNKSFYKNVKYFDKIASSGEDVYLSKGNYIKIL